PALGGGEGCILPRRLAGTSGPYRRRAANHRAADEPAGYRGLSGADDRNREPDADAIRTRENAHHRRWWRSPAGFEPCGSHVGGVKVQAQPRSKLIQVKVRMKARGHASSITGG